MYILDRENKCLTEDQARHNYKKVEMDKPVNIGTMAQEIEDDKMTRNRLKEEEDESKINPYQMAILNKKSREDAKIEEMTNWSIFSDYIFDQITKYRPIDHLFYFSIFSRFLV